MSDNNPLVSSSLTAAGNGASSSSSSPPRTLLVGSDDDDAMIRRQVSSPNIVHHTAFTARVLPKELALLSDLEHQKELEALFSKSPYNGTAIVEGEDVDVVDTAAEKTTTGSSDSSSPSDQQQQQSSDVTTKKKQNETKRVLVDYPVLSYHFEDGGVHLLAWGTLYKIQILSLLIRACGLVFLWLLLWTLLSFDQQLVERGGVIFDPVVCFVACSLIGKTLGKLAGVPPLIVIFIAGLMWGNIPEFGHLSGGITPAVRAVVGQLGLANILLRTGLAITPKTLAPAKFNILAMSVLPMLAEILVHGFMAQALFDFGDDPLWPFLQAMVAAPSASGVVAAVVMIIQQKGYTKTRGPGMLLIPACALDMTLGVWGVNFVASLLTRDKDASLAWPILQGPVQIVVGGIAGIALGVVWYGILLVFFSEGVPLPHGKYAGAFVEQVSVTASVVLGMFACLSIFVASFIDSTGGGCIACTLLGATAQYLTTRDGNPASGVGALFGCAGGGDDDDDNEKKRKEGDEKGESSSSPPDAAASAEKDAALREDDQRKTPHVSPEEHKYVRQRLVINFAMTWDMWIMPALFCFSGSALDVRTMFNPDTVGIAIGTIFASFAARSLVCALCSWSYPLTTSEWLIASVALGGKAFAQVALGGKGKAAAAELIKQTPNITANETQRLIDYGGHVANTGALSVLFVSPLVVVLLSVVGPKVWLTDQEFFQQQKQDEEEKRKRQQEEEGGEMGTRAAVDATAPTAVPVQPAEAAKSPPAVTEVKQPDVVQDGGGVE